MTEGLRHSATQQLESWVWCFNVLKKKKNKLEMELYETPNHINPDKNEEDDTDCLELPLPKRVRLKSNVFLLSDDEDPIHTESNCCLLKNTSPEKDALDVFNSWISATREKENISNDKAIEKVGENSVAKYDNDQLLKIDNENKTDSSEAGSPLLLRNSGLIHRNERKSKTNRKRKNSGQKMRRIDTVDDVKDIKNNQVDSFQDIIRRPKRKHSNRIYSDTKDDIIEIGSNVSEDRRSERRQRPRRSRQTRNSEHPSLQYTPLPCTPGGTIGRSASPATMMLVKQLEDDEMMARRLQEEFDAENISSNLLEPTLPSFDPVQLPMMTGNQRYPMMQPQAGAFDAGVFAPVSYFPLIDDYRIPLLQNYMNMMNTPSPPGRGRRGSRNSRNRRRYSDEFEEEDDGNNYETLMALAERLGPAIEKGLSAVEISQLPTFLYTPDCKMQNRSCSICMGDYETGENLRKLPCFHDYHDTCIDQWLAKNPVCPICRVEVQI